MADAVVVDTDILIDVGRDIEQAVNYLDALVEQMALAVSVVTEMELIVGCRDKAELRKVERFLRRFHVLPVTEIVSAQGVELLKEYRLSHGLLIADALIAATALSSNAFLASKNQRDYRFITDLKLLPYS